MNDQVFKYFVSELDSAKKTIRKQSAGFKFVALIMAGYAFYGYLKNKNLEKRISELEE